MAARLKKVVVPSIKFPVSTFKLEYPLLYIDGYSAIQSVLYALYLLLKIIEKLLGS